MSEAKHPKLTSPVNGFVRPEHCDYLRDDEDRCGKSGRWWEER